MSTDKSLNQKPKIPWGRILGYVVAFGALVSLGIVLARTWDDVIKSGFEFEFDLLPLVVSLVLLVIARGFAVEAWRRILLSLGEHFDFGFGARVWFLSNLTRYIPGNIWQVATMMVMVEQRGVSKTNALLSQVLYTALALAIAGLVGLMFIFARPDLFTAILPAALAAFAPIIAATKARLMREVTGEKFAEFGYRGGRNDMDREVLMMALRVGGGFNYTSNEKNSYFHSPDF